MEPQPRGPDWMPITPKTGPYSMPISQITRWLVKQEGNGGATLNSIMWVESGALRTWFPDEIQDKANKPER